MQRVDNSQATIPVCKVERLQTRSKKLWRWPQALVEIFSF